MHDRAILQSCRYMDWESISFLNQTFPTLNLSSNTGINMTRNYLTNKQRVVIQAESRKRRHSKPLSYENLAKWGRQHFDLSFKPPGPVLSRLFYKLNNGRELLPDNSKWTRKPAQMAIENRSLLWIDDLYISKTCLTGDSIPIKGKQLLSKFNDLLEDDKRIGFQFSAGWLCCF